MKITGRTIGMKETYIPIAGDFSPAEQNPDRQCPYPIDESILSIAPPSYESTNCIIKPDIDQGPGYDNTI